MRKYKNKVYIAMLTFEEINNWSNFVVDDTLISAGITKFCKSAEQGPVKIPDKVNKGRYPVQCSVLWGNWTQ